MRFIFKVSFILVYILFLSTSSLLANVDKNKLIDMMAETWKIQDQSLLENWSQYEIEEYESYNSDTNTNTHDQITSKPRLEWNEQDQILTVSYFSKYFKDKIGYIRIYLNEERSDDYKDKLNGDRRIDSVIINGVRFNFTQSSDTVEVFLGDLTDNDIDRIEDRLRVAVNSNEIFNPWLRINNDKLKKEFNDNPEYGYYLSKPQQEVLDFLKKVYEQNRLKEGALVQLPTGMGKTRSIFSFIKGIEKKNNSNKNFSSNDRSYRVLWFVSGIDILRQTTLDFNANFSRDSMFSLYGETNTEDNRKNLKRYNDLSVSLDTLVRYSSKKDQESDDEQDQEYEDEQDQESEDEQDQEYNANLELIENWINSSNKPVIIVVDEAHRSAASRYLKAIEKIREDCSDKISGLVGMTATPYRSDLDLPTVDFYGSWFIWGVSNDDTRKITTAKDQIFSASEQGYIPLISFRSLNKGSLSDETGKNSYDSKKLEENLLAFLQDLSRTNSKILIYHARGKGSDGRSTNRQAEFMEFLQNNKDKLDIKPYSINATYKKNEEGNNILNEFKRENRAILNLTMVGDYGIDIPDVDCIVFLDESDSQVRTVQRIGRSFRLAKNKPIVSIYEWGNGGVLENLSKKIFYNSDPRKIEERVKTTQEEIDKLKSMLDAIEKIKQQLSRTNKGFITEININNANTEDVRNSLANLSNLCEELQNILNQKEELTDKEILLKNIIERIINQNTNINVTLLQKLKELLNSVIYMSISELVEQLANFDINNKELLEAAIIEMVEFWIRKNSRYPMYYDYGTNFPNKVGVSIDKIRRVFGNNENPSGWEVLKERIFDSDKDGKYVDAILQSKFSGTYWYKNLERKEKLQKIYIKRILDFIDNNGRFPIEDDFKKGLLGSISLARVYGAGKYTGIFDGVEGCIIEVLKYLETIEDIDEAKKDIYLDAIYKSESISSTKEGSQIIEKCREYIRKKIDEGIFPEEYLFSTLYKGNGGDDFRVYIQKSFIKIVLLPFIDKNKRFPTIDDLGKGLLGNISGKKVYGLVGGGYTGIFDGFEGCIIEVLKYLENIEGIDEAKKDRYLDTVYKSESILKIKEGSQIIEKCREYIRKKIEDENKFLGEYLFSTLYKGNGGDDFRKDIQKSFIEMILVPFIDNNKRFPIIDDLGKGLLGSISFKRVYGAGKYTGIFDGIEGCIIEALNYLETIEDIDEAKKDIYLDAIYKSESISSTKEDSLIIKKCREYIRKKIDEGIFPEEYLFSTLYKGNGGDDFRKDIQKSFIKIILSPFIDKSKKFPSQNDFINGLLGSISLARVYGDGEYTGIFDGFEGCIIEVLNYLETIEDIDEAEKDRYLDTVYKSESILKIKEGSQIIEKCREYIRKKIEDENKFLGEYLFSNLYKGNGGDDFRKDIQKSFIEMILVPFIDKNKRFPIIDDLNKGLLENISRQKVYGLGRYTGIFDGVEGSIIEALNYLETIEDIDEAKKDEYLDAIYKSDSITSSQKDSPIIEKCREYIRKKIDEGIFPGEYLFPTLYKGNGGDDFRKDIQKSFIEMILLPFIDKSKKFPSQNDFINGLLGSISPNRVYGLGKCTGMFDSVEDIIIKMLEYIQISYSSEPNKTEEIKTLVKTRLEIIYNKMFGRGGRTIRIQKLCNTLRSLEMQNMFIECGCEDTLMEINKFLCTSLFSQVNP